MPELRPGMFTEIFAKALEVANEKDRKALGLVAAAAERQAKVNATGNGANTTLGRDAKGKFRSVRGNHTPGTGPSVVSGTLRRSITHKPVERDGLGWKSVVGMTAGTYPPYSSRTPASLYAYYLETQMDYPFLKPACQFAMKVAGPAIWQASFRSANWKVL